MSLQEWRARGIFLIICSLGISTTGFFEEENLLIIMGLVLASAAGLTLYRYWD